MITRLPCLACGEPIHPDTAAKTHGLCMPCAGGYRSQIEESRRKSELKRAFNLTPEGEYRTHLKRRVHDYEEGFEKLPSVERIYYALMTVEEEFQRGGLSAFFTFDSAIYYSYVEYGLVDIGAHRASSTVLRAKQTYYGDSPVPTHHRARRRILDAINSDPVKQSEMHKVFEQLDRLFADYFDEFTRKLREYAIDRKLFVHTPAAQANIRKSSSGD